MKEQAEFCYAQGDEGAEFCGDPKSLHCSVLGDAAFWDSTEGREHLVRCMRDDHLIHHVFVPTIQNVHERSKSSDSEPLSNRAPDARNEMHS